MTPVAWAAAGVFGACAATMTYLGRTMRSADPKGRGIVPFEKAGTWAETDDILDAWGERGQRAARASVAVDWVFVAAYTTFPVAIAAEAGGWAWVPAVAVAVAGACDLGENAALLRMLRRERSRDWPRLAKRLATVKFALAYPGLAAAVVAAAVQAR